ncbi:probable inactive purple acid phosphatase 28 [Aristolochia californica]|uniref:probable inactive purple acid phosphatase 28 n=1 Tax=Aristolochia californica TaxID=171875 RepID=UPI0035D87005
MLSGRWDQLLHLFLYLIFVTFSLFLLQTIFPKLLLGHETIRIKRTAELPLRFRYDGTFKILQVADMHYGNGIMTRCRDVLASEFWRCSDVNTTQFLRRMIQAEKPDFVAFTGDNIFGPSAYDAAESLIEAFGPVMESGLPWAAVLGNHDQESTMSREEVMTFLSIMDYSISQVNPSSDSPEVVRKAAHMDGFGNYNIKVHGASGSELANNSIFNLYFLDSGDRATVNGIRSYGWIKESQLRWLHSISDGFQLTQSPALAFFHIPIPEVRQLWFKPIVGQFQEAVACSSFSSGVLDTLDSMGDVKAVFLGHDHKNDFCGELKGIWFCYGGGFGYHGYGKVGWHRRSRVILAELEKGETSWLGVGKIKTWKRLDDEKLSKLDEQILWERQRVDQH